MPVGRLPSFSVNRIVAVLGRGLVPADTPLLRADDLGAVRGDGVFETLHVRAGAPWLLDEHLARMINSADRLDLDLPPVTDLIELARQACAAWPAHEEGALRLVCTRGPEDGGPPTVYATLAPVSPKLKTYRAGGVSTATLPLGVTTHARTPAPWLLGGVKSVSYAMNMACQRWAVRNGYDDALWLSTDGYALEAPTSTLLWQVGEELLTTPTSTGVLAGTTARFVLDHAGELGLTAGEKLVTPAELLASRGVWLASSVRGLVEVTSIDGAALAGAGSTRALQELVGYPV